MKSKVIHNGNVVCESDDSTAAFFAFNRIFDKMGQVFDTNKDLVESVEFQGEGKSIKFAVEIRNLV